MSRRLARDDPFAALGLQSRAGLTDDEVRAAWRRVAAATHPDRADGGDPARFARAAAAYTTLRTRSGRGEALADLTERGRGPRPGFQGWLPRLRVRGSARGLRRRAAPRRRGRAAAALSRARRGRPVRLAARIAAAAAISAAAAMIAGWQPATPALVTGAATWLALTIRRDLGPPP